MPKVIKSVTKLYNFILHCLIFVLGPYYILWTIYIGCHIKLELLICQYQPWCTRIATRPTTDCIERICNGNFFVLYWLQGVLENNGGRRRRIGSKTMIIDVHLMRTAHISQWSYAAPRLRILEWKPLITEWHFISAEFLITRYALIPFETLNWFMRTLLHRFLQWQV